MHIYDIYAQLTVEELDARRAQLEAYLHGVVAKHGSFVNADASERALRAFAHNDQRDGNGGGGVMALSMSPASTSISI